MVMLAPVVLAACGEDTGKQNDKAVETVKGYYDFAALPRSWMVDDVTVPEDGKVLVDMVVEDSGEVAQIKSRSRMLQFFIAKQGCPKPHDRELAEVDKTYRVWVRLWSARKEELTQSICPPLYEK